MQPNIRIAITPGEPAGIGPELILKLAQKELPFEIVAIANFNLLQQVSENLNLKIDLNYFDPNIGSYKHSPGQLSIVDIPISTQVTPGNLDTKNSKYVINALDTAIDLVKNNTMQAITTGPVQKSIINAAGIPFTGHTEYIADKTSGYPVMLLTNELVTDNTNGVLRVALATTHLAIAEVATNVTANLLEHVINVLHRDLIQRFNIEHPRICVCGLNPHAGEDGHLGKEEIEIIKPLLDRLRQEGMSLDGPIPADTAFTKNNLVGKDAILAMYHDQGLPVIKHSNFGEIVNVTLGLPIIRTSVDHGTALGIAGKGIADEKSLYTATYLAAKLATPPINAQ